MPPTCCLQEINCLACLERNVYRKTYRYDDFIKEVSLPICLGWSSEGVFLIPNSESIVLFPEAIDSRPNLFKPSYISTQHTPVVQLWSQQCTKPKYKYKYKQFPCKHSNYSHEQIPKFNKCFTL